MSDHDQQRLQKLLASWGVASRRKVEVLIRQGRVKVNGSTAELGMKVSVDDDIRVNGVRVGPAAPVYLMLNKPTGVVTTADDPQNRTSVLDLVNIDGRVWPVGRLDMDTHGLLLLTNDGDLAHRLMHPSYGVDKTYCAKVSGQVSARVISALKSGVELDDGCTSPAEARLISATRETSLVELVIHEGKNRQVRRMFDAVGHKVIDLVRTSYGPLNLSGLAEGDWRELTPAEIRRLYKVTGLSPARHRD